ARSATRPTRATAPGAGCAARAARVPETECSPPSSSRPYNARRMPSKWRVVAMLWCIAFFNYADRQAIFSVFPLLEREMHLTPVQLGLLGSGFAWVYGLASPLAGAVVDRVSRRRVVLAGLHVWSVICMATAASRSFMHLFLFRAAEGLGETVYFPASTLLISGYHSAP